MKKKNKNGEQDFEFLASKSQSTGQFWKTANLITPLSDPTNLERSEINKAKSFEESERQAIINEQDLFFVIGQLVRTLTFSICYIQGVFSEKYFDDEFVPLLDMKIKKLNPINAESCMLTDWMEKGVYDALQQRYLKTWVFGIFEESKGLAEAYTFSFEYLKPGVSMTISLNGNEKTETFDATSKDITPDQMRSSAFKMVRAVVQMMIHQDQMPGERIIMMKQMYYEDVTPGDYVPLLFRECSDIQTNWWIPLNMEAGNVTEGHFVTFKVNCVLDSCEDGHMLLEDEIEDYSADSIDSSDGSEDQLAHVHGTTILAIAHHTGIFMACDGLAMIGTIQYKTNEKKLLVIGRKCPHVVLSNSCGSRYWSRAINGQLKELFKKETLTAQGCAEYAHDALNNENFLVCCYEADDLKEFKAMEQAEQCGIIFGSCGVDKEGDSEGNVVPIIRYAEKSGIESRSFVCDGSGAPSVLKTIKPERFYGMSFEKARIKIKQAMVKASKEDEFKATGGLVRIKHINLENQITHVDKKFIHQIEKELEELEDRRAEKKRKREGEKKNRIDG